MLKADWPSETIVNSSRLEALSPTTDYLTSDLPYKSAAIEESLLSRFAQNLVYNAVFDSLLRTEIEVAVSIVGNFFY
jgi:hypothetical protein